MDKARKTQTCYFVTDTVNFVAGRSKTHAPRHVDAACTRDKIQNELSAAYIHVHNGYLSIHDTSKHAHKYFKSHTYFVDVTDMPLR